MDVCSNMGLLRVLHYVWGLLKIIIIIAPIIVILYTIFDVIKGIISLSPKEFSKRIQMVVKRIIACILMIMIPSIVEFVMSLAGITDYETCLNKIRNFNDVKIIEVKNIDEQY